MAWIELHQSLPRHKKTLRLARLLKCSRREAWALVAELWLWAVDNAPTGGPLTPEDIADAVEWPAEKDPVDLARALEAAGYLDVPTSAASSAHYHIHDWATYIQPLLDSREKNKKRVTKWREDRKNSVTNDVRNEDVTRNTTHNEQSNERETNALRMPLPYPTEPNRTFPTLPKINTGPKGRASPREEFHKMPNSNSTRLTPRSRRELRQLLREYKHPEVAKEAHRQVFRLLRFIAIHPQTVNAHLVTKELRNSILQAISQEIQKHTRMRRK